MPKVALPIGGGSYQDESSPVSQQQLINMYVDVVQAAALSQEVCKGTPGINQLATSGTTKQINRGSFTYKNQAYEVNGEKLYRVNRSIDAEGVETFTTTDLGAIPGTGFVFMRSNGVQLMILVPDTVSLGYIFIDNPDTLSPIVAAGFTANGNPLTLEFIASYFTCTTDDKKVIISSQNDGLLWNSLDRFTAEADPDPLVGQIEYKGRLFVFGSQTTQMAKPIATADTPIQIQQGFELSKGLSAPFAITAANNTFAWIGAGKDESPAIWRFNGSSEEKISTTAIDTKLQSLSDGEIANINAYSLAQKGGYFIRFNLPDTTLQFNSITSKWNDVQSDIIDGAGIKTTVRSRINSLTTAYGRVIVGDSQDGRIGELDPDIYSEYGAEIKRTLITQPFSAMGKGTTTPTLELTMESGVGNSDSPDPVVRMSRSTDGHTYSDERTRKIGKRGEYKARQVWRGIGRAARFENFKFVISDKVKVVIIKLEGDIRQLSK
jgi:hypothetical protein